MAGVRPRGVEVALPRAAESAGAARGLVRDVLGGEACRDDAVSVVSELVANAVQHTRCRVVRVTVTRIGAGRVWVGVRDNSRALPRVLPPGERVCKGRGLTLVAAFALRWGTELTPDGKCVWAELGPGAETGAGRGASASE